MPPQLNSKQKIREFIGNGICKPSKKCLTVHLIDGVQKSHNYKMCNFSSLIYFGKVQSDSLRDVKPINNISDYVRT